MNSLTATTLRSRSRTGAHHRRVGDRRSDLLRNPGQPTSARRASTPANLKNVINPVTGQPGMAEEGAHYEAPSFEDVIVLPDRTNAMAADLFHHLLATGGPLQKTIVFCVRDKHADDVATAMNRLYADWRGAGASPAGHPRGALRFQMHLRIRRRGHDRRFQGRLFLFFIATTVDLLSTGVDVPEVRNVVFFRYMTSPIAFYQMVGRGTRLAPEKLMFRVYDYTDAWRLFGKAFLAKARSVTEPEPIDTGDDDEEPDPGLLQGDGVAVRIGVGAGRYVLNSDGGVERPVPIEDIGRASPNTSPPRRGRCRTFATGGSTPRRGANCSRHCRKARPGRSSFASCSAWATTISSTCSAPRPTASIPRAAVRVRKRSATRRGTGLIRFRPPPPGVSRRGGRAVRRRGYRGLGESDDLSIARRHCCWWCHGVAGGRRSARHGDGRQAARVRGVSERGY